MTRKAVIRFSPYPLGKRFAVTFVDDTDLSTVDNTEPVYACLAQHGFWGTKTVWPLRAKRTSAFRRSLERAEPGDGSGATLQDADYAAFIRRLQAQGFEIALHGVAAGNSRRDEIEAGLAFFRAVLEASPSINAFHRTNLENLYCGFHKLDSLFLRLVEYAVDGSEYEGHRETTGSFWGDIARETFRYVRLPFHTIDEVNTLKINPSMPFSDPRRPYVRRWFAASDGADVLRFNRLLCDTNVRRLARQRGACIIYTHFAKGFARRGAQSCSLDPDFVRTVERVTSYPGVWTATASDVLDRLAAVKLLSLRHMGHRIEIRNSGDEPVDHVVALLPEGMQVRSTDGQPLNREAGSVVLPRLRPNEPLVLLTNRLGAQVIEPATRDISRREHRRIEYSNYVGLIRGWLKDRTQARGAGGA